MFGAWGHVGLDYCFEPPLPDLRANERAAAPSFWLRHVDYGLPGEQAIAGYRQSVALHCAVVAPNGAGWPPLRTPNGDVFVAGPFVEAPRTVGDFFLHEAPRFWGGCGAYRLWGPNSNTGLRRVVDLCSRQTGYRFATMPLRFRWSAWGWDWPGRLDAHDGPCPGYFDVSVAAGGSPAVNQEQAVDPPPPPALL